MSFRRSADAIGEWAEQLDEARLKKFFPDVSARVAALERMQGHHYGRNRIAIVSLLHRSALVYWPTDKSRVFSNERLEFLGDSFINFFVASRAMAAFPKMPEGALSKLRAALVSTENLAEKARTLHLQDLLMFGRGEIVKGGFRDEKRQNILADAFESVTAALLCDGGEEVAWAWLESQFAADLVTGVQTLEQFDVKTRFQQWTQSICGKPPTYKVVKTVSTPQETQFVVAGFIGQTEIARASATNKRDASKAVAARMQKLVDTGQLTEEQVRNFVTQSESLGE
jgi:ribonuclease III